jgi:hypothetical protein
MNRFEQLIEYVINDESKKAEELFHEIVVEKSRTIYESLMAEEAQEELDEAADEELDEAADEELDETMGGDAADDLIDDIEADESRDMSMEAEDDGDVADEGGDDMGGMDDMGSDAGDDMGGSDEAATKDDIMNLEDKLDELMAEFEQLMGDDNMNDAGDGDDFGADEGGDAIEVDDTEEMMPMAEAVNLKAAPKPTTSEEGGVNKKSVVAANAGAKGPIGSTVKPVHAGGEMGGRHDTSAYSNNTKDLIGDFQNKAGASMKGLKAAPKPVTGQAGGVNTKSPVSKA